jgi:hypothetical protein
LQLPALDADIERELKTLVQSERERNDSRRIERNRAKLNKLRRCKWEKQTRAEGNAVGYGLAKRRIPPPAKAPVPVPPKALIPLATWPARAWDIPESHTAIIQALSRNPSDFEKNVQHQKLVAKSSCRAAPLSKSASLLKYVMDFTKSRMVARLSTSDMSLTDDVIDGSDV